MASGVALAQTHISLERRLVYFPDRPSPDVMFYLGAGQTDRREVLRSTEINENERRPSMANPTAELESLLMQRSLTDAQLQERRTRRPTSSRP